MSEEGKDDKTVFGQPTPQGERSERSEFDDEKTVFGQPPPLQQPAHLRETPAGEERTQLDRTQLDRTQVTRSLPLSPDGSGPEGPSFSPELTVQQPLPSQLEPTRIALQEVLQDGPGVASAAFNPLMRLSADLLVLLGRLRSGLVDMPTDPLIAHIRHALDTFERNALATGVGPQEALEAKYALAATADDVLQNLPGADRSVWEENSMTSRFFADDQADTRFFQRVDVAMQAPRSHVFLLELMLACLSLGFQGQYRALPSGERALGKIRVEIHEAIRAQFQTPVGEMSPRWHPVPLGGPRRYGTPLWVIAAVAAAMVMSLYATLSTLLTQEGAEVRGSILAVHAGQPAVTIERTEPVIEVYEAPPTSQLERLGTALASQIDTGALSLERSAEWIILRLGEVPQFRSGAAELVTDFSTLAAVLGDALQTESGIVRVVGHTDSIPPTGRGQFKTNEALSVARAEAVAVVLRTVLGDPARVEVEGRGAVDPIADNATREGRAQNRRVEILLPREDAAEGDGE